MKVMVFDVGGTEIKYSVMDDTMNYYESGSVPTPSDSQEHFLETMAEIYRPHRDEVDGIALSLPGFIDAEHGVVKGGGAPAPAATNETETDDADKTTSKSEELTTRISLIEHDLPFIHTTRGHPARFAVWKDTASIGRQPRYLRSLTGF